MWNNPIDCTYVSSFTVFLTNIQIVSFFTRKLIVLKRTLLHHLIAVLLLQFLKSICFIPLCCAVGSFPSRKRNLGSGIGTYWQQLNKRRQLYIDKIPAYRNPSNWLSVGSESPTRAQWLQSEGLPFLWWTSRRNRLQMRWTPWWILCKCGT